MDTISKWLFEKVGELLAGKLWEQYKSDWSSAVSAVALALLAWWEGAAWYQIISIPLIFSASLTYLIRLWRSRKDAGPIEFYESRDLNPTQLADRLKGMGDIWALWRTGSGARSLQEWPEFKIKD